MSLRRHHEPLAPYRKLHIAKETHGHLLKYPCGQTTLYALSHMVISILLFNSLLMYERLLPYLVALVGVREQVFIKSLDLEYYLTT